MKLSYFRIGAIGMILVTIIAPIHFDIWFLGWMYLLPTGPFAPFFLMLLVTSIALFIGFILTGIGFFGYYKTYETISGLVGFFFPILFGWTLMLVEVYYFLEFWTFIIIPPWLPFPLTEELVYWLLKDTVLALTPIFWGIGVFQAASHIGNKRRTQVAGALLLASGLVYFTQIILDVWGATLLPYLLVLSIGTALLCLAGLLNATVFLKAQST